MPEALFQFLSPLWEMSLTAAFVAAVVILLRLVLKERAPRQVVCLLWLLVFARLLLPLSVESSLSLVPSVLTEQPSAVLDEAPQPSAPVSTPALNDGPGVSNAPVVTVNPGVTATQSPILPSAPVVETPGVQAPAVEEEPADAAPISWTAVLAVVWAAGFGAMLLYGVGSWLALRRRVRFALRTKDGVWECPSLPSPFILGLFRPKVYLPCGLNDSARQFILCHEQAHLHRGDHIVKLICWLALALHWFNPLVWVAFLLLSRDMEVACDQKVLRELGSEVKADYSATLLALATNGRFPAPTPLAFGEGDAKTRIKSVLSFKKPALWVTIAAVVIAVAAAVCLLTDPVKKFDPEDYATYDHYPGLYFEEITDERYGITTTKAYRLVDEKPELVAGWVNYPANNFTGLIHPNGEEEHIFAAPREVVARYEQYLADACLELNSNWVTDCLTPASTITSDSGTITIGAYYTPEGNLLLRRAGRVQELPLRYAACAETGRLTYARLFDIDADGEDELLFLWDDVIETYAVDVPGDSPLCTGDYFMICEWDGKEWTAYGASTAISTATSFVRLNAETGSVTVYEEHNFFGTIHLPIPEGLGKVESISVSPTAQIRVTNATTYVLTYTVYAIPEGGTEADMEPVYYLNAQLTYNGAVNEFSVVFTGASDHMVIGEGTVFYPYIDYSDLPTELVTDETIPADPNQYYLVGALPEEQIYLYAREAQSGVLLVWGDTRQTFDHRPHEGLQGTLGQLPEMAMIGDDRLAVVSVISSGQNTGIEELVVYQRNGDGTVTDYVYDWSANPTLQDFNRNNTLTYHADTNSFTMSWNGATYDTGPRAGGYAQAVGAKDGASAVAEASGQHTRFVFNGDGTISVSVWSRIAAGSPDIPDDYGNSIGSVGFDPTWVVRFTGSGFEMVEGSFHFPDTAGQTFPLSIRTNRLAAATNDFYVIREDGTLIMWGRPEGVYEGSSLSNVSIDSPVELMDNGVFVAANFYGGVYAIDKNGTLWGLGLLADPDAPNEPLRIMDDVAMVSAGQYQDLILKRDGTLWYRGVSPSSFPVLETQVIHGESYYHILDNVIYASSGGYGAGSAILADGTQWKWDYNGELLEETRGAMIPEALDAITVYGTSLVNVEEIAYGEFEAIILKRDGSLWRLPQGGALTDISFVLE